MTEPTTCWACSLPPIFCHGTPVPLCARCKAYVGNPLAGVRISTVSPQESAPITGAVHIGEGLPPGLDATVKPAVQSAVGADAVNTARAERDRQPGCMCAAELLVRGSTDARCPLHGAASPRAGAQ